MLSLDTAADAPTRNFLGPEGALVADVLVQSVGLAAYLVPTVMFGWAFRLMLERPIRRPLRGIGFLLLALVLGAASCSILHPGLSLPAGAGGTVGWVLLSVAQRAGFAALALPLAMAAAALVALLLVSIIGLIARRLARIGERRRTGRDALCPRLGARHGGDRGARPACHSALAPSPAGAARRCSPPVSPWTTPRREPPRAGSVVTPLPDRREPQLGRASSHPGAAAAIPEAAPGAVTARLARLVMPRAKPPLPGRRAVRSCSPASTSRPTTSRCCRRSAR